MSSIKAAYLATVERIEAALAEAGREPNSAHLLAVSKTRSAQAVAQLAQLGQKAFGENYVSEGVAKIEALKDLRLEWHFIGPIQSNKTRAIAESFDWVHSIDRLKLISRLNDQRPPNRAPLNVLIQVNLDGETQKAGCAPSEIEALADVIGQSPRLRLRGLMAIPAPRTERIEQAEVFNILAGHFHELQQKHSGVDALSAGMSDDLEAAIEAGANWVRVGTALFGPRASA